MSRVICALFLLLALATARAEGQPPNQPPPNQPPPNQPPPEVLFPPEGGIEAINKLGAELQESERRAKESMWTSRWVRNPWVLGGLIALVAATLRGVTLGLIALVAAIGGAMAGGKDDQEASSTDRGRLVRGACSSTSVAAFLGQDPLPREIGYEPPSRHDSSPNMKGWALPHWKEQDPRPLDLPNPPEEHPGTQGGTAPSA